MEKEITNFFDPPIKFEKEPFLRGLGKKFIVNEYFNKWQEYLIKEYNPKKKHKTGLFLPCSWGKPYSRSYIHYLINKKIYQTGNYDEIHQIILSNSGVVPREWENYYPFVAYDWNPNLEWDEIMNYYLEVTTNRLISFINKHGNTYEKLFCYLRPNSESAKAIKKVEKKLKVKIPNLCVFEISEKEEKELSLSGIYIDCDNILITEKNLENLKDSLL